VDRAVTPGVMGLAELDGDHQEAARSSVVPDYPLPHSPRQTARNTRQLTRYRALPARLLWRDSVIRCTKGEKLDASQSIKYA